MDAPDRVGTALWSIVTGSSTGAAACAAALLFLPKTSETLMFIFGGGIGVGVVTGWLVSGAIADSWRRAITAAICAFGTTLLMIGTIVVDFNAQALGIAIYGSALAALAVVAAFRARAAGRAAS